MAESVAESADPGRPAPVGTTIRFFLSSTFADFQIERDVLQERVFPELRILCAEHGFRLQPIDLRWGVSEEAGTERQTLRICFDELERCRQLSPDCFLLIQLGDRYGSHILPPELPAALVARLLPHLSPDERQSFAAAYTLDENAVPPEYVLRRASGPERNEDEGLRRVLVRAGRAAKLSEAERAPFEASATHREIRLGLLAAPPDPRRDAGVLCAVRSFRGRLRGPKMAQFAEHEAARVKAVRRLAKSVTRRLPEGQIMRYAVEWRGDEGPAFNEDALAQHYLALLRPRIEAVIATRTAAQEVLAAQGLDAAALANAAFEAQRAAHVEGRDAELERIAAYLAGKNGAGVPLVVTGAAGSGKSTLLAEVAKRASQRHPDAVLLTRYIGITPGTSSLFGLISNLRRAIVSAYGLADGLADPEPVSDLYQLLDAFAKLLSTLDVPDERPLYLLIDALDQLSADPQPIEWLPRALPASVRVVVSAPPDRPELAQLSDRLPAEQVLRLGPLPRESGRVVLRRLLAKDNPHAPERHASTPQRARILTPAQEDAVLDSFVAHGLPLYLQVAASEARQWRSCDPAEPLPDSTDALLERILTRLEEPRRHGPILVAHALGDLAAARNGLAEDELLAILAQDEAVRNDIHQLSEHSPRIREDLPLPAALWARLYADIERLLTEREADGTHLYTFFHRQLRDAVQSRYLASEQGQGRHRALAAFFEAQSVLNGGHANLRKLSEQPIQEATAGLADELRHTLTDVQFLQETLAYQGVDGALSDLALAPPSDDAARQIASVVRAGAVVLSQEPAELLNQITGRVGSIATLHDRPQLSRPHFRLRTQSMRPLESALLHIFQGHTQSVDDCALSADGRLALSASHDGTLRLWETASGREVRRFTVDIFNNACALSADGSIAVSAAPFHDNILRLWETASGRELSRCVGHTDVISCFALSADGRFALSGSPAGTLQLWDTTSGREVLRVSGHTDRVASCALSADGRLALSGSWDGTFRVWDVEAGREVRRWDTEGRSPIPLDPVTAQASDRPPRRTYEVDRLSLSADGTRALTQSHEGSLCLWDTMSGKELCRFASGMGSGPGSGTSFRLSADGRVALSASMDGILQLWDPMTGRELRRVKGHGGMVVTCALSADGHMALSGSWDNTLRLWNMSNQQEPPHFRGHSAVVKGCALSSDGQLALSASSDGTLRLWETASGREVRRFEGHTQEVDCCALSADARLALSGSGDGTLRLWDTASGQELRRFGDYLAVKDCALSADGHLALCACADGTLLLWDSDTGQQLRRLKGHEREVRTCALSPDGQLALSASRDTTLRLWETASGREVRRFEVYTWEIDDCALSADGSLAIAAVGDALRLWETASGREVRRFAGHTKLILSCAFSADGRLILSGSADDTLRLWATATGDELARWRSDTAIWCCALAQPAMAVAGDGEGGVHFLTIEGLPGVNGLEPTLASRSTSQRDDLHTGWRFWRRGG